MLSLCEGRDRRGFVMRMITEGSTARLVSARFETDMGRKETEPKANV